LKSQLVLLTTGRE